MILLGIQYYRVGILPLKLKLGGISKLISVALRYVSPSFIVLLVQNQGVKYVPMEHFWWARHFESHTFRSSYIIDKKTSSQILSNLPQVGWRLKISFIPPQNVIAPLFPQRAVLPACHHTGTRLGNDMDTFCYMHEALTGSCSSIHDSKGTNENSVCFISLYEHIFFSYGYPAWVCDELELWVEDAAIIFASGRMLKSFVMRLKSSTQLLLEIFCCVLIQLF